MTPRKQAPKLHVDVEALELLEFILFYKRAKKLASMQRVPRVVEERCSDEPRICFHREDKRLLARAISDVEWLSDIVRHQVSVHELFIEYMTCRVARLIGVAYPKSVTSLPQSRESVDSQFSPIMSNCTRACA